MLFDAARSWDAPAVAALLAASASLAEATDAKGRTALHQACAVKSGAPGLKEPNGLRTAAALIDAGADLEAAVPMEEDEEDFRATPVWFAVARGENLPLVQALLERGADPSPCLWAAVWRDDAVVCRALLRRSPRLDLRAHGETPIFYAARLERLKTLDLMIDAGANPSLRDHKGRNALDIARARRLPKSLIERLEESVRRVQRAASREG